MFLKFHNATGVIILKDQIQALSIEPTERSESIAQSLDILAQVLEAIELRLSKSSVRRSFSDHACRLHELGAPKKWQQLLGEIRVHRKTIDALEPQEQSVRQLISLVAKMIDASDTGSVLYHRRVRYRPHMVNTVGIDTPTGFGQFQLYHGSVIQMPCDILIVSGRVADDGQIDGQVVNALKWRYDIGVDPSQVCFRYSDEVWITHQQVSHPKAPFSHVLCLFLPAEPERAQELYELGLRSTFAALSALEYLDIPCANVGMSFLAGHRVQSMQTAVEKLVLSSLQWLKRSNRSQDVCCTLLQLDEVERFNTAMNETLGRSSIGADGDPIIVALRQEVLTFASRYKDGPLNPALRPLFEALNGKGDLCIELICTFSRTLCEVMVRECLVLQGQKPSGDLLSSIEKLRKTGMIAPWVSSYMHGLRVLGNKSVHPAHSPPKYVPQHLGSADLVSAMSAARCLLSFWDEHVSSEA
jgi:hypothetical protein